MKNVTVLIGSGSIGVAIARRVSAGKHILIADLRQENAEAVAHPKVQSEFLKEVKEINKTLGQHEEIKRFRITADSWSAQTGELSQTLKLKRKVLEAKYKGLIEEIFAPSREED